MPTKMDKNKTTLEQLADAGFRPRMPLSERKNVSVTEKGQKYQLELSKKEVSAVFQVDAYIINDARQLKCDYLVLVQDATNQQDWTEIFVELKGVDAVHGMEQLLAMARYPLFKSNSNKVRKARLVAKAFPSHKNNRDVEIKRKEFSKLGLDFRHLKSGAVDKL